MHTSLTVRLAILCDAEIYPLTVYFRTATVADEEHADKRSKRSKHGRREDEQEEDDYTVGEGQVWHEKIVPPRGELAWMVDSHFLFSSAF